MIFKYNEKVELVRSNGQLEKVQISFLIIFTD